jgi:hypothetical protein
MRAVHFLPTKPRQCLIDLIGRSVFTRQHTAVGAQNANVEALAAHDAELSAY